MDKYKESAMREAIARYVDDGLFPESFAEAEAELNQWWDDIDRFPSEESSLYPDEVEEDLPSYHDHDDADDAYADHEAVFEFEVDNDL